MIPSRASALAAALHLRELLAQRRVAMDAPGERPVPVLALEDRVGPGLAVTALPLQSACDVGVAAGAGPHAGARRRARVYRPEAVREQLARDEREQQPETPTWDYCLRDSDRRGQRQIVAAANADQLRARQLRPVGARCASRAWRRASRRRRPPADRRRRRPGAAPRPPDTNLRVPRPCRSARARAPARARRRRPARDRASPRRRSSPRRGDTAAASSPSRRRTPAGPSVPPGSARRRRGNRAAPSSATGARSRSGSSKQPPRVGVQSPSARGIGRLSRVAGRAAVIPTNFAFRQRRGEFPSPPCAARSPWTRPGPACAS